eukprot:12011028-Prorocentrum_lima.AAC.1
MTSSLVGSEMCIRDRPTTRCSGRPSCAWCWPVGARRRPVRCGVPGAAVSYTHLTLPTICSV